MIKGLHIINYNIRIKTKEFINSKGVTIADYNIHYFYATYSGMQWIKVYEKTCNGNCDGNLHHACTSSSVM